jgi:arabinofuranosyltransferase
MRRSLPLFIVLLALAARLLPGPRTIDDSYITFRYTRHILAGEGMVYNPDERVLGTTTPLYAGCMAFLGLFSGGEHAPFPILAMGVNAIFDAITCLFLLKLGERFGAPRAGVGAACVWAILPFSVTFALGGLETSLYVMLLTGAVFCHMTGKHALTALFAALSLLTRPDALILLGPLALDRIIASGLLHRFFPKLRISHLQSPMTFPELLAAFLLPLLWFSFAWAYYGSPIPHSIAAKSVAYQLEPLTALIRLTQHYATPFMEHLTFGVPGIMVGIVLYPFLFVVGARAALKVTPRVWAWVAYPWLYFAVFALANPLIFRWYLTPPLPAYILLILVGLEQVLSGLGKRSFLRRAMPVIFVVFIPVFLSMRDWKLRPDHGMARPAPDMAWYKLELLYREAADALEPDIRALTASRAAPVTLAAGDVGALGYFTSARILDTLGLNSPEAIPYYPVPPEMHVNVYAVAPDLIMDERPDFVVLLEVYGREGLFKDPRFLEAYHLRLKIPTDIYASDGMVIYERNE